MVYLEGGLHLRFTESVKHPTALREVRCNVTSSIESVKEILHSIGIDITLTLTGLMGSLLMVSKNSATDIKTTLVAVASGTLSANYLTGLVVGAIGMEGKAEYGVAFLLGYFGLKGVEQLAHKYLKKHGNDNQLD